MADNSSSGGAGMGMIVGVLVVIVAVMAFFMFRNGGFGGHTKTVDINLNPPAATAPAAPSTPPTK